MNEDVANFNEISVTSENVKSWMARSSSKLDRNIFLPTGLVVRPVG